MVMIFAYNTWLQGVIKVRKLKKYFIYCEILLNPILAK